MNAIIDILQGIYVMLAIPVIGYHGIQTGRKCGDPEGSQYHISAARWHMDGGPFASWERTSIVEPEEPVATAEETDKEESHSAMSAEEQNCRAMR